MAGIIKVDRVQSDSNLAFNIGGSNVAYFNTDGINMTGNQIITGNGILRTTSGMLYANNGIAFPATQVSSSNANVLDDYEEGTFSPTWAGTSSNPTATYNPDNTWGRYTKIGNMVTIWAEIRTSAISGGSGVLIMALPFGVDVGNTPGTYAVGQANFYNVTFDSSREWSVEFQAGQQYCYFRGSGSATTSTEMQVSAIVNTNPALIRITGSYKTA